MEENEIQNELTSIRSMMERSSKFISLSGLSGILAGVYALIGAVFAYEMLYTGERRDTYNPKYYSFEYLMDSNIGSLLIVAFIVLFVSISTGVCLTIRKSQKNQQAIWGKTSRLLLFNMITPLISGGLLILIFVFRGYYGIVAPSSLIFYGIALVSASNFTFSDVKYLGLCEIALGLLAAWLPGYGLLFWAVGFGVLHIVYGSIMYFKYDK